MTRLVSLVLIVALGLLPMLARAVEPDEILDDPKLEARARAISANVRCVVCQNEPINTSNAGIARDLRILIRERLKAGDTDQEVLDFLVARYGDFVLFKPPFKPETWALWLAPFVIFAAGGAGIFVMLRRTGQRDTAGPEKLNPAEEEKLARIMQSDNPEAES
ncbi:cytochrome c-type biogenesis protein [Jhaorihella thermophila]|uniref:Cytochrome c-type biogenesis protein n=1 Tax=Jhaorihella thermophila TaxID=488547 RepID=A0A1H5XKD4_9RHOB|nr:cytochrome c-type biogenesis protein [Jhaorihella thermophila]SEG11945.1 cytochrome c-type biogenesis protein CcmH [Jhaorihella thermophila]